MASPSYAIQFSAKVSGAASTGSAGDVLIPLTAGGDYAIATSGTRGTRRSTGLALNAYTANQTVEIQQSGQIDSTTAGLGSGTASWVRVSSAGRLERATVSGSDDVVGYVETDGTFHAAFGVLTAAQANVIAPTGTGFASVTSGVMDAAAIKVDLASATYVTGVLGTANGGSGASNLTFPAGPSTIVSRSASETLTNKSMSGASNTFSAIPFSTLATGAQSLPAVTTITSTVDTKGTAVDRQPVHVQTTDATVTTLDSFTLASNTAVVCSYLVTGIKSDSSQCAAYAVTATFKNNAGTVAQVGTTTTTVIGESDAAWDCTIDNSTTTIRLRITGKAATTIQWTSLATTLSVIP